MKKDVRKITEGAMMVALVGVALFINRQLAGLLEYAMYWILTFPILIYTVKYGVKNAIVVSVSMLLLSFMIALPSTIFYLSSSIIIGIVYGGGVRKKWPNSVLLWLTGIFTFISYIITMVLFAAFFGYDPSEDIEIVTMLLDSLQIVGLQVGTFVKVFSILTTLLLTVLQTICIHLIAIMMMRRLKISCNPTKTIYDLRLPKATGYICIIIWVLFLLRNVVKLDEQTFLYVLSIYMVMQTVAIAYGSLSIMCILSLYRKRKWSFLIIVAILLPITQTFIAVVGIYDMLCDLRGRLKTRCLTWND